jgi:hypothetical protein
MRRRAYAVCCGAPCSDRPASLDLRFTSPSCLAELGAAIRCAKRRKDVFNKFLIAHVVALEMHSIIRRVLPDFVAGNANGTNA